MKRALLPSLLILAAACSPLHQAIATPTVAMAPTSAVTPSSIPAALGDVNIPNATIQYYDISGSTEGELRAEMDAQGPVGYDGYKGDATTKWFIDWNWPGYGTNSCDLIQATVSDQITVILPHWKPPANAPPALIAEWANYTRALAEHERGHVDFVVASIPSVLTAIKRATCATADAAAQAALEPIRQHDIDYDAATNHGATQGARFP